MGGAAKPISEQQLYSPLRIWCIGLAITAIGVIASDLWLDQPIALFVHRTVADKTIFTTLPEPGTLGLLALGSRGGGGRQ